MKRIVFIPILVFLFLLAVLSKGIQLPPNTKTVKPAKPKGYAPREFYIASVVDKRKDTMGIGQMHAGYARQLVTLDLPGGTAAGLYDFIQDNFRQNRDAMPVELHITNFRIDESFKGKAQKADLTAELQFYNEGNLLNQYSYSSYVSSGIDASEHIGTLVTQLTEQFIRDLDGWLHENKPNLQPSITVNVEMRPESDNDELIIYDPARPLSKADFMGAPDELSLAQAITYSGLQVKYSYQTFGKRKVVNIAVSPYFHKMNSWWRATHSTEQLLAHEQLHFDITALAACRLMEAIKTTKFTPGNFEQELDALRKQAEKDRNQLQQQYDRETNHSRVKAKQAEWERKIKSELMMQEYYSSVN